MRIFLFSLFLGASLFVGIAIPTPTDAAGLVVCGLNADDLGTGEINESLPCTACHILLMADRIIDWIMTVMTVIGIAVIFAMGILYIVSAGNEKMIGLAKGGIKAALIGITVILCAWLIVSTIIRISGSSGYFQSYFQNGTFSFTCNTTSNAGTASSTQFGAGAGDGTSGGGLSYAGNGSCQATSAGPCATDNLKNYCFGTSDPASWSKICQVESGGGKIDARSGTDICTNYGNRAFSGGLFQINIFSHGTRLGDSRCNNLGSKGSCAPGQRRADGVCLGWVCTINNLANFDYCMGRTFTEAGNIKIACAISSNGHNTQPWVNTANKCGIPGRI